jgi:hypothetical protein
MHRPKETLDHHEAHRLMGVVEFLEGMRSTPSYYAMNDFTNGIDNNINRVWQRIVKHTQPFMEKTVLSVPGVHLSPTIF